MKIRNIVKIQHKNVIKNETQLIKQNNFNVNKYNTNNTKHDIKQF